MFQYPNDSTMSPAATKSCPNVYSTNVSVKCIQFAIPRMNMYCVHLITILLTTFSKMIFIHMMSCEHSVAFTYNPHRWHRALPRGCTRSETTLLLAVREDENRGKMELHYGLSPMMVSRWPFTQYTYSALRNYWHP